LFFHQSLFLRDGLTTGDVPVGEGTIPGLQATDVVLGRGSGPNSLSGNVRFRALVTGVLEGYLEGQRRAAGNDPAWLGSVSMTASTKNSLCSDVMALVRQHRLRFLRAVTAAQWEEARVTSPASVVRVETRDEGADGRGGLLSLPNFGPPAGLLGGNDQTGSPYLHFQVVTEARVRAKIKMNLRFQLESRQRQDRARRGEDTAAPQGGRDGTRAAPKVPIHDGADERKPSAGRIDHLAMMNPGPSAPSPVGHDSRGGSNAIVHRMVSSFPRPGHQAEWNRLPSQVERRNDTPQSSGVGNIYIHAPSEQPQPAEGGALPGIIEESFRLIYDQQEREYAERMRRQLQEMVELEERRRLISATIALSFPHQYMVPSANSDAAQRNLLHPTNIYILDGVAVPPGGGAMLLQVATQVQQQSEWQQTLMRLLSSAAALGQQSLSSVGPPPGQGPPTNNNNNGSNNPS
jgi:hypothetical protein